MIKKELVLLNEFNNTETTLEYLYKPDLSDRIGYDSNFLGANELSVSLPTLNDDRFGSIAPNKQPNSNGKDYLDYLHFSTMHNAKYRLPYFTAVNNDGLLNYLAMEHDDRSGDRWRQDDRLNEEGDKFQFDDDDYYKSGFQKGHMVRYYDPAWGETEEIQKIAIGDTFHYTNSCPQVANFNVGSWLDLENYSMVRAVFDTKKVSIFCGPVFKNVLEIDRLNVPVTYWKILVYKKGNKLEAMGFLMSQKIAFDRKNEMILEFADFIKKEKKPPSLKPSDIDRLWNKRNLRRYLVKIELIEKKTGLDFGLNEIDINRTKDEFFFEDVDKEDRKNVRLMEYSRFKEAKTPFNDLEFIKEL